MTTASDAPTARTFQEELAAKRDPLEGLSARDYARIAAIARQQLAERLPAPTRALLLRGRCQAMVRCRMRWLLRAQRR